MGSYARIWKKYGQLILAKTVPTSYIDIELYFKWNIDSCSHKTHLAVSGLTVRLPV